MKKVHNLIAPAKKPKAEILRCRMCGSNRFREVILGPVLCKNRITGGTKILICDRCETIATGG